MLLCMEKLLQEKCKTFLKYISHEVTAAFFPLNITGAWLSTCTHMKKRVLIELESNLQISNVFFPNAKYASGSKCMIASRGILSTPFFSLYYLKQHSQLKLKTIKFLSQSSQINRNALNNTDDNVHKHSHSSTRESGKESYWQKRRKI